MTELPSGTVTFLFTDIEGSTRLVQALGDAYAGVLATHQRLLRHAFAEHGGHEVDTQGDSFFVAFRRAKDAVAAAVAGQRALAAQDWPDGVRVRVRMGLHSGEPAVGEERYTGLGVHRAARIAAAGHGGQVLLSEATRTLVEDDLPDGVRLRDLGRVGLKDFERLERVSQLVVDALPSEFPRLKGHGPPPFHRRRLLVVAGAVTVVVAAAAVAVFAFASSGSGRVVVAGNAVAILDPRSNRVTGQIPVGVRPDGIAFSGRDLWVANLDDQTVSRLDPKTRQDLGSVSIPGTPTGIAATDHAVWVVSANAGASSVTVRRIDPQFASIVSETRVGNVEAGGAGYAAAGRSAVWIAPSGGLLTELSGQTGRVARTVDPASGPSSIAIGDGAVWVTDADGNSVTRVDASGLVTPIPVGNGPTAIAVDASGVWVTEALDNAVAHIDPGTRAVVSTIPVGQAPTGIALGAGSVWVANSRDGTVTRIDEQTGKPIRTIEVGGSPQSLTFAGGRLWVTVDRSAAAVSTAGSGGTIRLSEQMEPDFLDPALAFTPLSVQILNATCVKLLNYPDKPAPAGAQLEPEAAKSLPTRSADGRT